MSKQSHVLEYLHPHISYAIYHVEMRFQENIFELIRVYLELLQRIMKFLVFLGLRYFFYFSLSIYSQFNEFILFYFIYS